MKDMPVIDTHVHLWDTKRLRYPWLDDLPKLNQPHLLDDYRQATAGYRIEGMVFIQCEADFAQAEEEARWVLDLACQEPRIRGVIPWAPLEQGDGCRPMLERYAKFPLVKGIRRIIQFETDQSFCLKPDFLRGVQLLAEYRFRFDICISHGQMANTLAMVKQCPGITFILDHIGKPDIRNGTREPWASQMRELARIPEVYCKISGVITEADHNRWTAEGIAPYIEHAIECFGPDRVMFGGDWPVVTLAGRYDQWMEALDRVLNGLSIGERRKLMHDNALRVYGLGAG